MDLSPTTRRICMWAVIASQFLSTTTAHSWPEALNLINSQGTIYGATGYVRNFVPRNASGFEGNEDDSFQKTQVVAGAKTCMDRQTKQVQSPGYPRLTVTPGATVALRYAENGHVTIEQTGRPPSGGPVYIYGTENGTNNPLLTDVMAWNAAGTGGNGQGKLLMTQNFDDGRCYENNPSPHATARAAVAPLDGKLALPGFSGLPCQNDFVLPTDITTGQPYTVYWVWNFTMVSPPGQGVEIYSDCMDFDVNPAASPSSKIDNEALALGGFDSKQPAISAAVSTYFNNLAAVASGSVTPTADPFVAGTASTAAQTTTSSRPGSAATTAPSTPGSSSVSTENAAPPASLSAAPAVVSEPLTGGGVFAGSATAAASAQTPAAAGPAAATVTKVVTLQPSPVMKTVYVTVSAGQTPAGPGAAPSATGEDTTAQSSLSVAETPVQSPTAQTTDSPHTPTIQSSSAAQLSNAAHTPAAGQIQSANGMAIPLITLGSSGAEHANAVPQSTGVPATGQSPSAAQVSNAAHTPAAGQIQSANGMAIPLITLGSSGAEHDNAIPQSTGVPAATPREATTDSLASIPNSARPASSAQPTPSSAQSTPSSAQSRPPVARALAPQQSPDVPRGNKRVLKKSKILANLLKEREIERDREDLEGQQHAELQQDVDKQNQRPEAGKSGQDGLHQRTEIPRRHRGDVQRSRRRDRWQ